MTVITEQAATRLRSTRDLVARGESRERICELLDMHPRAFDSMLARYLGTCTWPPEIPDSVFTVRPAKSPFTHDRYKGRGRRDAGIYRSHNALDDRELAARIEADQAKLHSAREHWLKVEAEKYDLPRPGKLIDGMAA